MHGGVVGIVEDFNLVQVEGGFVFDSVGRHVFHIVLVVLIVTSVVEGEIGIAFPTGCPLQCQQGWGSRLLWHDLTQSLVQSP